MNKFFFFFFFISGLTNISAQTRLSGKVTDEQNQPLGYANILLMQVVDSSLIKGDMADENGNFLLSLSQIKSGNYFLQASMIGYENFQTLPFYISGFKNENQTFEIVLNGSNSYLDEVTVSAKKPVLEQKIDRTIVNVQNSTVATGSDVLTILERSPGIEIDRINNQIQMQGKQGATVMLDGKIVRMEVSGLIQLLQGMSSDNIEAIELITTPPASFDAEGDAGIINIRTKKQVAEGINSDASLNMAYGRRPKIGGSFNLNLKKNKLNFFADGNANYNQTQEDVTIFRQNKYNSILTTTNIFSRRPATTGLYNYRLGLDYEMNQRSTVGVLFSGYLRTWDMAADLNADIGVNNGEFFRSLNQAHERNDWKHWMANLNFSHRFDDNSTFNMGLDYLVFSEENPIGYEEDVIDENGMLLETNTFFSRKFTDVDFQVITMDFTKPLSEKWKIEAGVKGSLSGFTNDIQLANLINGQLMDDPRFTDVYFLDEKLGAVYSSVDFQANTNLSFKAGLRYEYYHSDLTAENDGAILLQSYGRIFPSVFLSYQISETQRLTFSYSKRITRPSIRSIAPAFAYWGYNTILGGNPDIRPAFTNQLNLSYRYKTVLVQFQFSDDDDALTFQPEVFAEDNLMLTRSANMPDKKTALISFNNPISITSWWQSRLAVSAYWFRLQPFLEGQILTFTDWYTTATLRNNFQLPKNFSIDLSAKWNSTRRSGLGVVPAKVLFDLGIKKTISPKFSLTFNWSDLFNWGSFYAVQFDEPDLNIIYDWNYDTEGNVFRLSINYNFGNAGVKKAQSRKIGAEEERRRMN